MLVRESSLARMERRIDAWAVTNPAARVRLKPVIGDLHEPLLGIDAGDDRVTATNAASRTSSTWLRSTT